MAYVPAPGSPRNSIDSISSTRSHPQEDDGYLSPSPNTRPTRARTMSTSTSASLAFFQPDLLPLSLSENDGESEVKTERNVGLLSGIALVVSLQIGSGIFSSPGVVLASVHSVGASLVVWVVGGLLAWTGASSFAELGSMIPLNGGAQAYLAYAYGPLPSYLFAWTAILLLKPGSNAIIALIFGEYVNRLIFHTTKADVLPNDIPDWAIKLTGVLAILVISLMSVISSKTGTRAAVLFLVAKVASLVAITVMGLVQLARGKQTHSLTDPIFSGTSTNPSSFALALYSGLWAYDGWDQVNYIGGEMKNVERNLPRVIHISMGIVLTLFLAANVSYFVLLDKSTVSLSNTVALDFGKAMFGPAGGIVFAAVVAFSCFGALNGSFYTSARLIRSAALPTSDAAFLPHIFSVLHPTRRTPIYAMGLQAVLTIGYVVLGGGFRSLVNFYSVASWGFYFATVLGLVVLRIKEPGLERPYRTWIITPLTFSAVALFLLCMPIFAAPIEALAAVGFILAGVPVYYITQRRRTSSGRSVDDGEGVWGRISGFFASIRGRASRGGFASLDREERVEMLESRR